MLNIIRTEGSTPSSSETENLRVAILANIAGAAQVQVMHKCVVFRSRTCARLPYTGNPRADPEHVISCEGKMRRFEVQSDEKFFNRAIGGGRLSVPWKIGHVRTLFRSF